MDSIKKVKLFKILKKKDIIFASKVLETSNEIEDLINKKTTVNFPNYTNHDIHHSISIMNIIYELIKNNIKEFNQFELALMIYSALFHDIGMSISDDEILNIKKNNSKYLDKQNFQLIVKNFKNEELAIQNIIRKQHGKIANDLIANEYAKNFTLENGNISFAKDLGLICQSHTEGEYFLNSIKTDERKGDYSYNPQFIAILLRVADILDISATRTPLKLYHSINLSGYSDEEWLKNIAIENNNKIFKKNGLQTVRLDGNVRDIKIHRKLLNYIDCIEDELQLAVEKTQNMQDRYILKLNTKVKNNIESVGYSIPNLKLNMDYKAVTNLLMGESVYGSKDLGLRELIQNSIDACLVKKDKLEIEYKPIIEINISKENNEVIIKDNGMGMNKNIIEKYFLNIGKSYYKSEDFLNYEHSYNPIGNFGIGFLSCFMLSSHVKVITKHHNDKYKYKIDLEQDSEYISFTEEEDYSTESGTQIILNYDSFMDAMGCEKDDYKSKLIEFIDSNILIDEFEIKINNEVIDETKEEMVTKENEYIIDVNKYTKNLHGKIKIGKTYAHDSIESLFEKSVAILYFDGEKLNKVKNFNELEFKQIINENSFVLGKTPLLGDEANKKFEIYTESSYMEDSYAFESLSDQVDSFIYILSNKNFTFEETYANVALTDTPIYLFGDVDGYIDIEDIVQIADIESGFYTPVFITERIDLLYTKNESILKINNSGYMNRTDLYIKNIKVNFDYSKQKIVDFIQMTNLNINIKDNNIIPSLNRKTLIDDSNELLRYTIYKIVHEYALENFDLSSDKKVLLKRFKDTYYSESTVLMNDCNSVQ